MLHIFCFNKIRTPVAVMREEEQLSWTSLIFNSVFKWIFELEAFWGGNKVDLLSALDHSSHTCTKYVKWLVLCMWVRSQHFPPNHLQACMEFADINHVTVMNQKQNRTTFLLTSLVGCFTAPPTFESAPQNALLSCKLYQHVSLSNWELLWRHVYIRPYLILQHLAQWVLVFD